MKLSELLLRLEKIRKENPNIEEVFVEDSDGFLLEIDFCQKEIINDSEGEIFGDAVILNAYSYSTFSNR